MIRRFFRWVRGLPPHPTPIPGRAAHPAPFARLMHLAGDGFVPACGAPREAFTFTTVETQHVNCPPCKALVNRRAVRRITRVR